MIAGDPNLSISCDEPVGIYLHWRVELGQAVELLAEIDRLNLAGSAPVLASLYDYVRPIIGCAVRAGILQPRETVTHEQEEARG